MPWGWGGEARGTLVTVPWPLALSVGGVYHCNPADWLTGPVGLPLPDPRRVPWGLGDRRKAWGRGRDSGKEQRAELEESMS